MTLNAQQDPEVRRETGRRFIIAGERVTTRRVADGCRLARALKKIIGGKPKPPQAPAVKRYSEAVEAGARYLIRGYHDHSLAGRGIYLEPGFRHLVGQPKKPLRVHIVHLRPAWQDHVKRALERWHEACGFEFEETEIGEKADILMDDEERGAWLRKGLAFAPQGREVDGRTVVHAAYRFINIHKEWPDRHVEGTFVHELGHAFGLGHSGPYNGSRPPQPFSETDSTRWTVMSYFGVIGDIGEVDRCAVEMLYA